MTVSLLDYLDLTSLPSRAKPNTYKSVTKEVQFLDSIIPELIKITSGIKEDLEHETFGISTSKLFDEILNIKGEIIDGCISRVKQDFPSIYFNKNLLTKSGYHMKPFDGRTFINFMRKTYEDIDYLTLGQWRFAIIDEMVPARREGGEWQKWEERTIENIKDIDSAGIELYFRGNHFEDEYLLNIVIKFSKFVFNGCKTNLSQLEGIGIPFKEMEAGKAYPTTELKSVRFYQGDKHRLKIGFKTPEQRQLFKEMLFTPTWELLGREEPYIPEFKDACDICLFKEVSCMQCNNYDHWVGSCKYCTKNNVYPSNYRNGECDLCRTGHKDSFVPLASLQKLEGLMQEEGYYHHYWKARNYQENNLLKVHCFAWGGLYKHYKNIKYPAPVCLNCRNCITEIQDGKINQICKSERAAKHSHNYYYIYNCKKTLPVHENLKENVEVY